MKMNKYLISFCMILFLCISCSSQSYPSTYPDSPAVSLNDLRLPQADDTSGFSDGVYVDVDTSHQNEGYIMAKVLQPSQQRLKLLIEKDGQKYNYDVTETSDVAFPLQLGNGIYEIRILRQIEDENYARLATEQIDVILENELSPFLFPSQIVNYNNQSESIQMAFELVKDDQNDLERITHLYEYVVTNISYDQEKADKVNNQFVLPNPDETLQTKKGICFDYASLLTAMLRSQNIPTRLVTGYTDIEYHAWVEIYLDGEGWINPKVYFEKETWSRMDPTFAASDMDYEGAYDQVYIY